MQVNGVAFESISTEKARKLPRNDLNIQQSYGWQRPIAPLVAVSVNMWRKGR